MVHRLRGGCIDFRKAEAFNSFLQAVADDTRQSQLQFWESLRRDRLGLISTSESSGGATQEAVQAFLK